MLSNILPGIAAKTLADNGSSPALTAANLAALIDGTGATGYAFGGQSYTANLCAGGTPMESGHYGGYVPANAFDGNSATFWLGATAYPGWVGYQFAAARTIAKVRLLPYSDGATWSGAKDFAVDGSNDGTTWTTVYTGVAALQSGSQEFTFTNATAYPYWRVKITSGYGAQGNPGLYALEMMEAFSGSLKVLLDISALTPVTEVRYLTDETDTTKVTVKGSTDGITYTTYSSTNSGAGYLAASIGNAIRYVSVDHIPAAPKTAYEIEVIARRLEKQAVPNYRIFQFAQRTEACNYAIGAGAPITTQTGVTYGVYQPLVKRHEGRYHVLLRTEWTIKAAYQVTQQTLKEFITAYCVRPPMPAIFDPASSSPVETLLLGLLHPGEMGAEFTIAIWNDKGKLNNALKMGAVRITVSLAREGQFTGGGDPDGQEFVSTRWLEVRSSGTAGTGITDDAQTGFTPVGGDPAMAGLLVGDIPPNCARYLHCRVNVPANITTTHTARPRLVAVFNPAPVCGFGKNHGTEFGG